MSIKKLIENTLKKNTASFVSEHGVEMTLKDGSTKLLIRHKGLLKQSETQEIEEALEEANSSDAVFVPHEDVMENMRDIIEDAKLEGEKPETTPKKRGRKPKNAAAPD